MLFYSDGCCYLHWGFLIFFKLTSHSSSYSILIRVPGIIVTTFKCILKGQFELYIHSPIDTWIYQTAREHQKNACCTDLLCNIKAGSLCDGNNGDFSPRYNIKKGTEKHVFETFTSVVFEPRESFEEQTLFSLKWAPRFFVFSLQLCKFCSSNRISRS